jgi:hypothetical protein
MAVLRLFFYFYFTNLSEIKLQLFLHGVSALVCAGCGDFHGFEGLTRFSADLRSNPGGDDNKIRDIEIECFTGAFWS